MAAMVRIFPVMIMKTGHEGVGNSNLKSPHLRGDFLFNPAPTTDGFYRSYAILYLYFISHFL